jgi:hypothetical protein
MALVTRFETPGKVRDLPDSSPFYGQWHDTVSLMLDNCAGDVVTAPPGSGIYNASHTEVNVVGPRTLVWMGFPRLLLTADHPGGRREAFSKGETRGVSIPGGRTTQNEYLEWFTERDQRGRITKVTFTTETIEYWSALFRSSGGPERVLELYRQLLGNPGIELAELKDARGNYNPLNVWNTERGIIHFIVEQPPNTFGAALLLVALGVSRDVVSDNFQFGETLGNSADPRVTFDAGGLARKGLQITTADPFGIYLGSWDDTGWSKPDGSPVDNYWQVVRPAGASGPPALRLVYEVPASEGFVVGDIRIGGRPIEFGGQIAEHLSVMLPAIAGILP